MALVRAPVTMGPWCVLRSWAEPVGERPIRGGGTEPVGESPIRGGVGAPGSRPPAGVEMRPVEAWRQEPLWREQERGPQLHVNPAASSNLRWESRAAHV